MSCKCVWLGGCYRRAATTFACINCWNLRQTQLDIKAPFLFHVIPHFIVGIGPTLQIWLQRGNMQPKDATYGLGAIVGGYF